MNPLFRPPFVAFLLLALTACVPQTPPPAQADSDRFLVYFEEFSADLSPEARSVVEQAAARARAVTARGIRLEARASATGSPDANKKLADTRNAVVADQLQRAGVARAMIHEIPIGQTGSNDPTITDRRVDIVVEH